MKRLLLEFKSFAARGNVIDLAIGVVIGSAFGKIVSSLVNDVIMPLFGLITGRVDLSKLVIPLQGNITLKIGSFIQSVIDFLIITFAIFMAVKAINTLKRRLEKQAEAAAPEPKPSKTEELLEEIRDILRSR
jgi:large conductance mechanosensitive channel